MIEIVRPHWMRMQLEAGKVCHPSEGCRVAWDNFFCRSTRGKAQRHDFDPRRPRLRCALLVEEFTVDAIRVPNKNVGAPASATNRPVGYRKVVADDIELCVSRLRKENLVWIGDRDFLPGNSQDLSIRFGSHSASSLFPFTFFLLPFTFYLFPFTFLL